MLPNFICPISGVSSSFLCSSRNSFEETAEKDPENIIAYLKNEGNRWSDNKEPDDDVTFVVIKIK